MAPDNDTTFQAAASKTRLARLLSLGTQSAASVTDQAAAAAIGLVVSVYVGRMIGAEALGIYAIASVLVMIVQMLQNSALLEAMSVFGPRRASAERGEYLGYLLVSEVACVGGVTLIGALGAVAWFAAGGLNHAAFFAVLACLLYSNLITFQYLIQRQFYVDHRPFQALIQSSMFLLLVLAGLALLAFADDLSVAQVYGLLAACSAVVCLVQAHRWRHGIRLPERGKARRYAGEHWRYGRWVLATTPFFIFTYHGYFFLAGLMLSVEETGYLKAAETLVAVFAQVGIGLSMLLVPMTSRRIDAMSVKEQKRHAGLLLIPLMILAAGYAGVLLLFGEDLLGLLFGESVLAASEILPIMALLPLFQAIVVPASVTLTARKRPDLKLLSYAVGTLATLTVGTALIDGHGLWGAAAGLTFSMGLFVASQWACLAWLWRDE